MNLYVSLNQKMSAGDLLRILLFVAAALTLLFIGSLAYLFWGHYHVNATYELVDQGMTRQQVDEAIGWYAQTDIELSDVNPGWAPRSSGDITACGFLSFYFYVVYEDDRVVEVIPAFE